MSSPGGTVVGVGVGVGDHCEGGNRERLRLRIVTLFNCQRAARSASCKDWRPVGDVGPDACLEAGVGRAGGGVVSGAWWSWLLADSFSRTRDSVIRRLSERAAPELIEVRAEV